MTELLLIKLRTIFRNLFRFDLKSVVRLFTYLLVISLFLFGSYFVFNRIFIFLLRYEEIGAGLVYRIFSLMFSMFFVLLIMSSIVSSIATFFRTEELEFLFSTPMRVSSIFAVKLIENGIYASWATSIMAFPLMMALGKAYSAGADFYVISILIFLLLIITAVMLGLVVVFIFSGFFLKYSTGMVVILLVMILVVGGLSIFFGKAPDIFNLPKTANLNEVNSYVASLEVEQFRYIPSGIAAEAIFNLLHDRSNRNNFLYLGIMFLLLLPFIFITNSMYRKKYISFGRNIISKKKALRNRMERFISFNNKTFLMIQKDIIIFLRDPSQWGQSLIFLTLLTFYVISLIRSPIYFKTAFYTYILAFANLGFSAYISATLSVRFIYPLISLEGNSFQLIKSSIPMRQFFNGKLIFNFLVVFILGEVLVTGTNMFLRLDLAVILVSMIVIFIMSIGITIINIGFGAIFPEFNEKNPSKIASGFGGIIAAMISLVYVGISLSFIATPTRLYFESAFRGIPFNYTYYVYSIAGIVVLTIILFVSLYPFALKRLSNY